MALAIHMLFHIWGNKVPSLSLSCPVDFIKWLDWIFRMQNEIYIYNPTMSMVFQHPLVPPRTSQPQVWRRPAFASPGTCLPATCATGTSRCTRSPTTSWPTPSMRRTSTSPTPLWTLWGWRWTQTTSSRSRPTPVAGPALGATVCTSGLSDAVSALDGERNWKAHSSFTQLCVGDNSLEETSTD